MQVDHVKNDMYHYNVYYYVNLEFEGRYFYAMDLDKPEGFIEPGYTLKVS